MSSVTPPVSPSPPPPVQGLPTATLSVPPPELAQLSIGSKLDAIILSMITKGIVDIETSYGKLQLQTGFSLPKDAPIQLQLIGKGNQFQFLITAIVVSHQRLHYGVPGAFSAAVGTATNAAGSVSTGDAAPVKLLTGTQTTATLLRAAAIVTSIQAGSSPGGGPMAVGSTGALTSPAALSTGSTAAQGSASAVLNTRAGNSSASSGLQSGVSSASQQSNQIPAGTRFNVKITSVIPANQMNSGGGIPDSGPVSFANGRSFTGIVVGQTSTHHPIVQTHAGPIAIVTSSAVPTGTTIQFQILEMMTSTQSQTEHAVIGRAGSVIMETRDWSQLDDAIRFLRENNPAIAQQIINSALPRPDSALTANILFFISALRSSEIRNWFGDAPIRALERLRPDMASRLSDDFRQIGRLSDDDAGREWRAIPIPMLNGSEIEQIRLFMRRRRRDKDDEMGPETRFVIDVDLSQIGRIQMDGLIIEDKKRFDLIIRTENRLTPNVENDIRTIFVNANELTGTNGGLVYRAAPPDFVEISSEVADDDGLGLIV